MKLRPAAVQRGWEVVGGRIVFRPSDGRPAGALEAADIVSHCMAYAKELERIV